MDHETAEAFIDALGARVGIVAAVGAGGKKSTLYRLLEAHRVIGTRRILMTATVQIAAAPASLGLETVIAGETAGAQLPIEARTGDGTWFVAGPPRKPGRFSGLAQELIPTLHEDGNFDLSLVKADGARMRMIKAPSPIEPALPDGVATILPIVSARAFGRPLGEKLVHRPERLAALVDAAPGTALTPEHVARLLVSEAGMLQNSGSARVIPVINMVDDDERRALAQMTANIALTRTRRFDRIVLARMSAASPLIEVIGTP